MSKTHTIYALSSAPGRGGVAVVRVSGAEAGNSFLALTKRKNLPKSHVATLCKLYKPLKNKENNNMEKIVPRGTISNLIDQALVIYFQSPASFTGENVVEYHVHGGSAIITALLDALGTQENHRMALPGEFTRRAFENGKMDLTQAEAIADLIDAETDLQKSQALSQLEGGLSKIYEDWTERLKKTLAHLEADIEFPDEDLPEDISPEITLSIEALKKEIADHLSDNRRGERLRDGLHLAIIGAPNAGKSTLINALARRDIAIVSDIAGTTRDIIETHLNLGGYPVIIADTAGLRPEQLGNEDHDKIESEGIRRAMERAGKADLKILLFDGTASEPDKHTMALTDENALLVINKSDAGTVLNIENAIHISARNGKGMEELEAAMIKKVATLIVPRETPSLTRRRHREALEETLESINRAQMAALPELMAEDLRLAIRSVGRITGRVDVEELLDVIFKDFCIGK